MSEHERLKDDVAGLTRAIKALDLTLKSDYPTRHEIKKRRVQIIVAMVGAIIASYFFTVGTISYCFLQGIPEDGSQKFCYIFAGYDESFDNNREFRLDYAELQKRMQMHEERLAKLESEE